MESAKGPEQHRTCAERTGLKRDAFHLYLIMGNQNAYYFQKAQSND